MEFDNLLVRLVNKTGRKLRVTVRAELKGGTVVWSNESTGVFGSEFELDQLTFVVEEVQDN